MLQRFKLTGLKYVDLATDGPDAMPSEPHDELDEDYSERDGQL